MLSLLSHLYSRSVKQMLCLLLACSFLHTQAEQPRYEIYVFYNKFCHHCKAWMNSTGTNYETEAPSYLGNSVPKLTKYDLAERQNMTIYKELLSSGKLSSPIDGVPAFIIVDENQIEINRNIGAMSTKDFYQFVNNSIHSNSNK